MRSSETLERQINNFVLNVDKDWYRTTDYYRLSTLYSFAEYLAWVRLIERRLGFIAIEHSHGGRRLDKGINGLFRAMSSFHYFRWNGPTRRWSDSAVPRRLFTAMGEVSIVRQDGDDAVLEFSDFCVRYVNDQQFRRWFRELDEFLAAAGDEPFRWDRLIAAGANLRILVRLLERFAGVGARPAGREPGSAPPRAGPRQAGQGTDRFHKEPEMASSWSEQAGPSVKQDVASLLNAAFDLTVGTFDGGMASRQFMILMDLDGALNARMGYGADSVDTLVASVIEDEPTLRAVLVVPDCGDEQSPTLAWLRGPPGGPRLRRHDQLAAATRRAAARHRQLADLPFRLVAVRMIVARCRRCAAVLGGPVGPLGWHEPGDEQPATGPFSGRRCPVCGWNNVDEIEHFYETDLAALARHCPPRRRTCPTRRIATRSKPRVRIARSAACSALRDLVLEHPDRSLFCSWP